MPERVQPMWPSMSALVKVVSPRNAACSNKLIPDKSVSDKALVTGTVAQMARGIRRVWAK